MKIKRSQLVIMFLVGFAACQVFAGAPIVLVILMTLFAAGALVCAPFGLTLKLPKIQSSRLLPNDETEPMEREAFVLGIGHQVRR